MQTTVVLPFFGCRPPETSDILLAWHGWPGTGRCWRTRRVSSTPPKSAIWEMMLFQHAADLTQGYGFFRASELATTPHLLVVAHRERSRNLGGTVATATRWNSADWTSDRIELEPTVHFRRCKLSASR